MSWRKNDIQFVLLAGWKKNLILGGEKKVLSKPHSANTLEGDFHKKKEDLRMVL